MTVTTRCRTCGGFRTIPADIEGVNMSVRCPDCDNPPRMEDWPEILWAPVDWDYIDRQLGLQPPRVCVLIATKDGEATIGDTVFHASFQADVFVVSDGSTDGTVAAAWEAGATDVVHYDVNVGKPNALREAFDHFDLRDRYDGIVVCDDDTRLDPHFVPLARKKLKPGVAAVCGEVRSDWQASGPWNWLVSNRALAYWRYGIFIKTGQNVLNAITVLPGSNTLFDIAIFDEVVHEEVDVIVDDTQWLMEIQTRKLGRVTYERNAKAYIQDPTTFSDYYKQMKRWMGGTFQGVFKYRIGRSRGWFSFSYAALILDWVLYVFAWPALTVWVGWRAWHTGYFGWFVGLYFAGYFLWSLIAAIALRHWRLVVLFPTTVVFDWLQRWIFVHSFIWALRNPRTPCIWKSPERKATNVT